MPTLPRALAVSVLGALALGAGGVSATSTPSSSPAPATSAIFDVLTVVASKDEVRLGQVPATVTVIDRAAMDRQQVQGIADLLRYQPGASATGSAGRFGVDGIRLRGMEGDRVAISLDGIPAPQSFAVGSFSAAGRNVVEPELLESVEIVRGPASMVHGSDALGGAVAAHSRTVWSLTSADSPLGYGARTSWDQRDQGVRLAGWGAARGERSSAVLQAAARRFEEVEAGGDGQANPASGWSRSGQLRLERNSDVSRWSANLSSFSNSLDTNVDHLIGGPGQYATTTALAAADRSRRVSLAIRHELVLGATTTSTAAVFASRDHMIQDTSQWRDPDPRTPVPTLRDRRFDLEQARLGANWLGELAWSSETHGSHHLLGGFDTSRLELEEQRDGQETNLTTGARTNVILGEHFPVRDFPLSSMETFGAFLADRWTLPSGRAAAHLGVRYDRTRTSTDDDPLYQATYPGLEIVDADFSAWTPRAGATLDLGRGHSAYVSLTEGYRAPPVYDTNVGLRLAALGYEALPNPNLRPERSRGFELGWRYAGSRLSIHLAAYHNRYRDLIESRALIGRDPLSGITSFQSINRDRATIQGVEGWIQAVLGTDAVTGGSWTATVALSAAEGRDTRRDVTLSTVDPATVTTTVGWSAAAGSTSIEASWTFADRTQVAPALPNGAVAFAAPAYDTLDLHASIALGRSLTARLSLRNALDQTYWVAARTRRLAETDPAVPLAAEPGRALVLGLEWRR